MDNRELLFVTLVGSLRSGSHSRAVAQTLDELAPDEVQVDLLPSVGKLPHYNDDIRVFSLPAEVVEMGGAIAAADGVIIVTPEYNSSVPGALKNALDWFSQLPQQVFDHKPVAIQTTLHGMVGGLNAQAHLRQMLASLNAVVLRGPEVIIPCVTGKIDEQTGLLSHKETRRTVASQLAALAKLVRKRTSATGGVGPARRRVAAGSSAPLD